MTLAFNEPKYQIENSDFRCQACAREIPCEASYFSAVLYQEGAFHRKNFCDRCWQPATEGLFAYWKTKRPAVATDQPRRVRFDTPLVLGFFLRLGEEGAPDGPHDGSLEGPPTEEKDQLRFVLSLLLIRKKVLNFVSSYHENGAECLKLTEKDDAARVHWVKNPELNDAQLERVKVRIGELLQMQM